MQIMHSLCVTRTDIVIAIVDTSQCGTKNHTTNTNGHRCAVLTD